MVFLCKKKFHININNITAFPFSELLTSSHQQISYHDSCAEVIRPLVKNISDTKECKEVEVLTNSYTLSGLLKNCGSLGSLEEGKHLHAHITKIGFHQHFFLQNNLLQMYIKCRDFEFARQVFDKMPQRDVITWTSLITGYAQNGHYEEALALFDRMECLGILPNKFTFASVVKACAGFSDLERGKGLHDRILRMGIEIDVAVENALIDMYTKCGSIDDARHVFDKMPQRDVFSWNAMISGCLQSGCLKEAKSLFWEMPKKNVVSWNAIIRGYALNGWNKQGLEFIYPMCSSGIRMDQYSFCIVIGVCSTLGDLEQGKQVHGHVMRTGFDLNVVVGNALVDMYAKCRSIDAARNVFDKMSQGASGTGITIGIAQNACNYEALRFYSCAPILNVVSWNAMISGYTQDGQGEEAVKLFRRMLREEGVKTDEYPYASALKACASIAVLEQGKQVHTHIVKNGYELAASVGSALVDMYAKCGSIGDASKAFSNLPKLDVILWTAMITGCAQHGLGNQAIQLFEQMLQAGIKPNEVSFVGLLVACSHSGLVDEGRRYFNLMSQEHGIIPKIEHYVCMVDLLGRSGHLGEAEDFINKMPVKPNEAIWGALLNASRIHGNIESGKSAAEHLLDLRSQDGGMYALLSNVYSTAGRWDDAAKVRKLMEYRKVKKTPGCSWIVVKNKVHSFFVGDRSHPQTEKMYILVEKLAGEMKQAGYVPDTNFVGEILFCMHEDQLKQEKLNKENILCTLEDQLKEEKLNEENILCMIEDQLNEEKLNEENILYDLWS